MDRTTLPLHAVLTDPATGHPLQALGIRRNGTPIWPVIGGSAPTGEAPPATPPAAPVVPPGAKPADPPKAGDGEDPNGAGSKQQVLADLAAERKKRQDAEARVAAFEREKLTESERFQADARASDARATTAEAKAMRYEVCADPAINLPLSAAQFLSGGTEEEIRKSALALKTLMPSAAGTPPPPAGSGLPPAGGAGGNPSDQSGKKSGREAGIAEAERRFGKPKND